MLLISHIFFFSSLVILMREEFLLPDNIEVERQSSREIGITTLNVYRLGGNLEDVELEDYPKYAMDGRGWEMVHWHRPSNQEVENILALIQQEDISEEVKSALEKIKGNKSLIAYSQDKDATPLSEKDYQTHEWIELYFVDIKDKKLTHISYGKF
tara:strand:- start:192 stop:656 length:465 start_codon:yes stop_codon:yes gene_type:complete